MAKHILPSAALALLIAVTAGPVTAQQFIDHAQEYDACLRLIEHDASEAFEAGLAWQDQGGGDPAAHCVALALLELKHYGEAALRLQRLADGISLDYERLRPEILAQAGQAWLLEGELERAKAAQDAALKAAPNNPDYLIDRAVTHASASNYWPAIEDLNRALNQDPNRADALIYRASAYRQVKENDLARRDVDRALAINPENPEGLLERGILRRYAGDDAGARQDWVNAARIAEGTPTASAAQNHLADLDLKVE